MKDDRIVASRLIALFLAGGLAFGYPLLALFNVPETVLGVPVLYAYLFGSWTILIALLVAIMPPRE
ncbi:MAG TPA: hypothetical protein VLD36_11760 [Burkholderiales bacterium]|nr:hypothetical protein [Burkholderiales bacterium]